MSDDEPRSKIQKTGIAGSSRTLSPIGNPSSSSCTTRSNMSANVSNTFDFANFFGDDIPIREHNGSEKGTIKEVASSMPNLSDSIDTMRNDISANVSNSTNFKNMFSGDTSIREQNNSEAGTSKKSQEVTTYITSKLSSNEIEKTLKSIEDILVCSICFDTVRTPLQECINGHLVCKGCKTSRVVICPVCLQPFSREKTSLILTQIINAFPHPCKNTNCTAIVINGDGHYKYCNWRPIKCLAVNCNTTCPLASLVEHVGKLHFGVLQNVPADSGCLTCKHSLLPQSIIKFVNLVMFNEYLFWKIAVYDTEMKQLRLSFLPISKKKTLDSKIVIQIDIRFRGTACIQVFALDMNKTLNVNSRTQLVISEYMLTGGPPLSNPYNLTYKCYVSTGSSDGILAPVSK